MFIFVLSLTIKTVKMGTRNLTMVISNGQTKVAQYGQWDGYPEGQGLTALNFLSKVDLDKFKEAVSNCTFATDEQLDGKTTDDYPQMSRDNGAGILSLIMDSNGLLLNDSSSFAKDSLFCEWAYLIDFDKNTFEVYEGFNKSPLIETDRFYTMQNLESEKEYYPVKMVKSYSLSELPEESVFLKDFENVEEKD